MESRRAIPQRNRCVLFGPETYHFAHYNEGPKTIRFRAYEIERGKKIGVGR